MPTNFNIILGKKIREIRKLRQISLSKLADRMQVSYQQLQKYETGTNRISAEKLHQVAEFLDINVEYFFPAETPEITLNPSIDGKFIAAFSQIKNPQIKEIISKTVEKFAAL